MKATSPHRPFPRLAAALLGGSCLVLTSTLLRAQSPGSADPGFQLGPDSDGSANALVLQGDGRFLVGGSFTQFRGAGRNAVARLNPNGSLDSFSPGLAFVSTAPNVNALAVQADGKVLAAGRFSVFNQPMGGGVVRLNADGSLDAFFNVGTGVVDGGGIVGEAYALAVLPGGQVLVGGDFTTFNGAPVAGLVRLNSDGTRDPGFNPGGAGITGNAYGRDVRSIAVQPDGRILIGGHFQAYDGRPAGCVARLNADGTPDPTFNDGVGADYGVTALALQADGKVLVGGGYNSFDNASVPHLVRLNPDGSLDTGFYPQGGGLFIGGVDALLVQPDGSVLLGGQLLSAGGLINGPHNGVARLLGDGTVDTNFDSGTANRRVLALALQPDGKALVASNTNAVVANNPQGNVARVLDLPAAAPTVSVVGVPDQGGFLLTRAGDASPKFTVHYHNGGSAGQGQDYVAFSGKVKFAAGQTAVVIPVTLLPGVNRNHKVKVFLDPGTGYGIGKAQSKVFLSDL